MTSSLQKSSWQQWQDRVLDRWAVIRPMAFALAIGLVMGPLISNYMGWQVTRSNAEQRINASGVEQQAMVCAALAQANVPDTASLGWTQRSDLADKYAVMPGRDAAAPGVANACAQILARPKA